MKNRYLCYTFQYISHSSTNFYQKSENRTHGLKLSELCINHEILKTNFQTLNWSILQNTNWTVAISFVKMILKHLLYEILIHLKSFKGKSTALCWRNIDSTTTLHRVWQVTMVIVSTIYIQVSDFSLIN